MYKITNQNRFKKDLKICKKRGYEYALLRKTVLKLAEKGKLPNSYKPHKLSGNYKGYWECHIKPDWLLIWLQDDENKEITLVRTGTHSDLFE